MAQPDAILFFLCLNDRGGAESSMIRLAQGLRLSGRSIVLAVYGAKPELAHEWGFDGEVVNLQCHRTLAAFFPLYRLLRRRVFKVTVSALLHSNLVTLFAACLAGRHNHVIVTEHSIDSIQKCRANILLGILTRVAYRRAVAIVAVSRELAVQWKKFIPSLSPQTIYNPVVEAVKSNPPPAHAWLVKKTLPVIVGIGRLKSEKNFALLIQSFALLVKQKPARLIILGEGEQRAMLETMARDLGVSDQMLMPGFVSDPRAWLGYADLFVLPSHREGFGNVIVEALDCGVPVVATDCPCGPAEILEWGRLGTLVPVGDAPAMARAMSETLSSTPDRDALCRRASDFTVTRCVDAYAGLVDNIASL